NTFDFSAADTCGKKAYIYCYLSSQEIWIYDPGKSSPLTYGFPNGTVQENDGDSNTNTWIVGGFNKLYSGSLGNYFTILDPLTKQLSDSSPSSSNKTFTNG